MTGSTRIASWQASSTGQNFKLNFHTCSNKYLQVNSGLGQYRLRRDGVTCSGLASCCKCWYGKLSIVSYTESDSDNAITEGLPRNLWKLPQTFGRAGRDKSLQAVGVQMFWPGQKGN